jgi:predicted nuclease of restriction endonuclease-like (RecB) superfamily
MEVCPHDGLEKGPQRLPNAPVSVRQKGLSVQNLWRMRQFYLAYRDEPNLSPLVTEISWTNHLLILGHTESATEREFYLRMNISA